MRRRTCGPGPTPPRRPSPGWCSGPAPAASGSRPEKPPSTYWAAPCARRKTRTPNAPRPRPWAEPATWPPRANCIRRSKTPRRCCATAPSAPWPRSRWPPANGWRRRSKASARGFRPLTAVDAGPSRQVDGFFDCLFSAVGVRLASGRSPLEQDFHLECALDREVSHVHDFPALLSQRCQVVCHGQTLFLRGGYVVIDGYDSENAVGMTSVNGHVFPVWHSAIPSALPPKKNGAGLGRPPRWGAPFFFFSFF